MTLGDGDRWVRGMLRGLRPDAVGPYGVTSFGANLPGLELRQAAFFGVADAVERSRAFDGCYQVTSLAEPPNPADTTLAEDLEYGVRLAQRSCRPRAFLASAEPVADLAQALSTLHVGPSSSAVVWEGGPKRELAQGEVQWVRSDPERLQLRATADRATALVVGDPVAPGWSARVDGVATPIYATDVVARGLDLPAGEHAIELTYETPGLRLGAGLSILGLALALGLTLWRPSSPLPTSPPVV